MSLRDLIDAAVRCVKCGKGRKECACYVPCYCGWLKERGEEGCRRCLAVVFQKVGPSQYRATIGKATIETSKEGIHWRWRVRFPDGGGDTSTGVGTNKGAKAYGVAAAFLLGAESPPPTVIASSRTKRKG